jgi:hypothetical protein
MLELEVGENELEVNAYMREWEEVLGGLMIGA